ncbi:hypothetical protein J6590_039013 [Homalodisca vitripennis]|nr:hypothetical protein J6590_039013 [Homalodisca vitripennis]
MPMASVVSVEPVLTGAEHQERTQVSVHRRHTLVAFTQLVHTVREGYGLVDESVGRKVVSTPEDPGIIDNLLHILKHDVLSPGSLVVGSYNEDVAVILG